MSSRRLARQVTFPPSDVPLPLPPRPAARCRRHTHHHNHHHHHDHEHRWKHIHHWLERSLFTDAFASCSPDARCIFKWDHALAALGAGTIASATAVRLADGLRRPLFRVPLVLPRGAGSSLWRCGDGTPLRYNVSDPSQPPCRSWNSTLAEAGCTTPLACIVQLAIDGTASVEGRHDASAFDVHYVNEVFFGPPVAMRPYLGSAPAQLTAVVADALNADGSANVTVSASGGGQLNATALFVTLTASTPGRFTDNAFTLSPGSPPRLLRYLPFFDAPGGVDVAKLAATLRLMWAFMPAPEA
jgi:hypothetical protein